MTLRRAYALYAICAFCTTAVFADKPPELVPGCPNLDSLQHAVDELTEEQIKQLKCVCSLGDDERPERIFISCIYGSTLSDLARITNSVVDSNRTVAGISMSHVSLVGGNLTLGSLLSQPATDSLQKLEVKSCPTGTDGILFFTNSTAPLAMLEFMALDDCALSDAPASLLNRATGLRHLSLKGNKLTTMRKEDFASFKQTLEYLDISGNLLFDVERGVLRQLQALKQLVIGEHNYASEAMLDDVGQLQNLATLDMTRMDGFNSSHQLTLLENVNLKTLVLTGCSLKRLNASAFAGVPQLEELDMRVNLLDSIEAGAFAGLTNLRRLSLAGNFLRESVLENDIWQGLKSLEHLDLGWNEFTQLPANGFASLGTGLTSLNLRHNDVLAQADAEAFKGLSKLKLLNLTECSLGEFNGEGLIALEELDVSFNRITSIEAIWSEGSRIRVLDARNNSIKRLSPTALDRLQHLEEIDISGNPWICDSKIIKTTEWITKRYRMAQKRNEEFLLKNANETLCDRPYNKRGQLIFELTEPDVVESYNERSDTTTPVPTSSTASVEEQLENVTINWQRFTIIAGDESNNTLELAKDDVLKPAYDINSVRYGEKHAEGPRNASVAPVLILGTAFLLTAVGIVLVLYQKTKQDRRRVDIKDEKEDATGDTAV